MYLYAYYAALAAAALVAARVLVALARYAASPLHKMPGPSSLHPLGQMPGIIRRGPCEPQLEWARRYGPMVAYRTMGTQLKVLVNDPDAVRRVLVANARNYVKPKELAFLRNVVGNGLLTSEGEEHARQRRHISAAFRYETLRGFVDVFAAKAKQLCDNWDALGDGAEVDMSHEMARLTMDALGLTVFRRDMGSLRGDGSRLYRAYRDIFSVLALTATGIAARVLGIPTPAARRANEGIRVTRELAGRIIKERREARAAGGESAGGDSLLDLLLEAREADGSLAFTDQGALDQLLTFLIAGHETTAGTLSWCLHLLSSHPEVADRAVREVRGVLGDGPRAPTHEDMARLPFVEAVVKETLRLRPAAALTSRRAVADDTLGGYRVPAGTVVFLSPLVQGRLHTGVWGDDADEFRPGRWVDGDAPLRPPAGAWTPFLLGARSCIGQRFAMFELVASLAVILPRYRAAMKPGAADVKPRLRITLQPSPALPMLLTRRR